MGENGKNANAVPEPNVTGSVLGLAVGVVPRAEGGFYLTVDGQEALTILPSTRYIGQYRVYSEDAILVGTPVPEPQPEAVGAAGTFPVGQVPLPGGGFVLTVGTTKVAKVRPSTSQEGAFRVEPMAGYQLLNPDGTVFTENGQ